MTDIVSRDTTEDGSSMSSSLPPHLPPKVEITVERLDGIVWSTPKPRANQEELKKRVPFVTAAVEFAGTCPNMKLYSANKYPHTKHPAVESYFAALGDMPKNESPQAESSEVRKITSTTTQEFGATTTKTTTTTVTTIQSVSPMKKSTEGHYPLVAKWYDDSSEGKLVDSITYFTNPYATTFEDGSTLLGNGTQRCGPHLTLTLPRAADQERPSLLTSVFSPCHRSSNKNNNSSQHYDFNSNGRQHKDGIKKSQTHSTAASTHYSLVTNSHQHHHHHHHNNPPPAVNHTYSLSENIRQNHSSPLLDLGSLLDQEEEAPSDEEDENYDSSITSSEQRVKRQDTANVAPVIATKKSKELAATAIAAEPSSAVVGRVDAEAGALTPLSWMGCGSAAPEIIELRVRVIPEDDSDELAEINPSKQHLASMQDLEGVAHLIFFDQIIEEGTTVMDLPLKIVREARTIPETDTALSVSPNLGGQEYVTLGANAKLRVRVTILPQGRGEIPTLGSPPPSIHETIHQNNTMKTQSLPEIGLPFYTRAISLFPLLERLFQIPFFRGNDDKQTAEEYSKGGRKGNGSFPHEFPAVVPDNDSKKVDTILRDWKKNFRRESLGWHKTLFETVTGRGAYNNSVSSDEGSDDKKRSGGRQETAKRFYTIPNAPRSSSSLTDMAADVYQSLAASADSDVFTRLQ